jgi:Glycosyltransferase
MENVGILQTQMVESNGAELVSMMQAQELEADLWCSRYNEDVFPGIAEDIEIKEYGSSVPSEWPLSITLNTILAAFKDPSFLSEYDAVICHKDLSEILAFRAKQKYGLKMIWYMHNTSDLLYRSENMPFPIKLISRISGRLRNLDQLAFDSADRVLANSKYTKNQLVTKDFGTGKTVEVLYPPIRQLEESPEQQDYVAVLSRVGPAKNLEQAIEEMEGRSEKLVFGGSVQSSNYKRKLEKLAEDKQVEIEFRGYIEDDELGEFLSEAKFGIYPSTSETFGLVPLEMLKVGTPCFVNKEAPVSEVLPEYLHLPLGSVDEDISVPEFNHFEKLRTMLNNYTAEVDAGT